MSKIVIVLAAPGGSGKSTTSRAFAIGEPQVFQEMRDVELKDGTIDNRKCIWTIYDNCGLTGSPKSGTDSNVSPKLVRMALWEVLKEREIAIIDGYMASAQWVEAINEHPDVEAALVVHFDLSHEELLRRIAKRLGMAVDELPDKRKERARSNMTRPGRLLRQFENLCIKSWWQIDIYDDDDTDTIVELIDEAVCEIFQDCKE